MRFREVRAVDGVSLEVGSGEFFSLLGPSGCGVHDGDPVAHRERLFPVVGHVHDEAPLRLHAIGPCLPSSPPNRLAPER
jgi:ABC-type iron transport system FetAB ATPase subunit